MTNGTAPMPFSSYRAYGPYGSGRKIMVLVGTGHRTTISYARYLMSVHLGRELTSTEHVDHIDDDCTNDALSNLQILTPEANKAKQDAQRHHAARITATCPECGEEFTRLRRFTSQRRNGSGLPAVCSRACAGVRRKKQYSDAA